MVDRPHVPWEDVSGLLRVCELARNWPTLRALHDEAMNELADIQTDMIAQQQAIAKKLADKQAASARNSRSSATIYGATTSSPTLSSTSAGEVVAGGNIASRRPLGEVTSGGSTSGGSDV